MLYEAVRIEMPVLRDELGLFELNRALLERSGRVQIVCSAQHNADVNARQAIRETRLHKLEDEVLVFRHRRVATHTQIEQVGLLRPNAPVRAG